MRGRGRGQVAWGRLRRSQFERVFREGRPFRDRLAAVHVLRVAGEPLRVGFAAARSIGNSVRRNRARRRVREAFREGVGEGLQGCWIVVVARPPVLEARFEELVRGLARLLERCDLGRRCANT